MASRLPSAPPILPGLAYIRPLGSGGFADVFLYEQDMPRRNVAVKVHAERRARSRAAPDVQRRGRRARAPLGASRDRHRLPGGHLGGRPAVHRHGVLPGVARAALPHRAHPGRRGARRSACGWRARSSPRTAPVSSTATSSRATSSSRRSARPCSPTSASRRRCSARPPTRCSRCRSRGAPPRWSPSRPREPSPARCGASARPSTRCSPATARSSAASAARTPRSSCAAASRARATPPIARTDVPASLQDVLARAMSRDPARRFASAREFAEALRAVQAELGISPTPLEIPDDEWSAASGSVDFADTALRGAARSHVVHDERRKTRPDAGVAALARDEDTDISMPDPARRRHAAVDHRGHRRRHRCHRRRRGHRRRGGALNAAPHDRRASPPPSPPVALVIGASVVWPGLDAQETPEVDTAVWALQTGEGRRYARVNTTVGELDTVRSIEQPDKVVQIGRRRVPLQRQLSKVTRIDEALPADLDDEALRASPSTPAGTTDVATAGDFVGLPDRLRRRLRRAPSTGAADAARPVPVRGRQRPAVHRRRDRRRRSRHPVQLLARRRLGAALRHRGLGGARARPARGEGLSRPAITAAGDDWAVVDAEDGDVWLRGADAADRRRHDRARRGRRAGSRRRDVYLADETALVRVGLDGACSEERVGGGATVLGTPAQPIVHDGEVFAAWLPQGDAERRAVERAPGPQAARLRRAGRSATSGARRSSRATPRSS